MALDEPNADDVLETSDQFTMLANEDLRSLIEQRGGLSIDYIESFFGNRLIVKLAGGGECGCG